MNGTKSGMTRSNRKSATKTANACGNLSREIVEIAAEGEVAHRAARLAVTLEIERTERNAPGVRARAKEVGFLATLGGTETVQIQESEPRAPAAARLRQTHGQMRRSAVGRRDREPLANLLRARWSHRMGSLSGPSVGRQTLAFG